MTSVDVCQGEIQPAIFSPLSFWQSRERFVVPSLSGVHLLAGANSVVCLMLHCPSQQPCSPRNSLGTTSGTYLARCVPEGKINLLTGQTWINLFQLSQFYLKV